MVIDNCDWEPCPWLKKLIDVLLTKNPSRAFELLVKPRPNRRSTEPSTLQCLNLWYCPFCGTRIFDNKDVLAWVERRRGTL